MTDDRLGDRVIVSEIDSTISGNLPHPQDPWSDAPNINSPFTQQAARPTSSSVGAETSYDPRRSVLPDPLSDAKEARDTQKTREAVPVSSPGTRPLPPSPVTSSESSTLKRFREVFGLKRVDVVTVPIARRDPHNPETNVEILFGLRGINYDDYQWVLEKTREMIQDPALATFAWKAAFISMGVASIDGVPLHEVFGIQPVSPDHVRDPMYPHMGLRFQAASAFCDELRTSLFELVEHLYVAYEQNVDSKYLPKAKSSKKDEKEGEDTPLPLPQTDSVR